MMMWAQKRPRVTIPREAPTEKQKVEIRPLIRKTHSQNWKHATITTYLKARRNKTTLHDKKKLFDFFLRTIIKWLC